ncbi:SH3 domain-containing protein [Maricaulaceae bacterium MS644]
MHIRLLILALTGALLIPGSAFGQEAAPADAVATVASADAEACMGFSGLRVPRFVSLRYDEAVGRSGPSGDHPRLWVYQRAGLPVEVIQETPDWRKVRDPGGVEVWMHRRLLTGRRSVWALEATDMLARPDAESSLIARIEPDARLWLERCRPGWCRLEAGGRRGWARADAFWGLSPGDRQADGALEGALAPCYRSDPDITGPAAAD